MSGHDLYLVLRERVETVAEGNYIGKDVLDAAQQARGFSSERMGRELGISEKTWRRWKAAGTIPQGRLDEVAEVLRLEIERPRQRVTLGGGETDQSSRLEELLGRAIELLEEVLAQRPPPRLHAGAASKRRA